MAKGFGAPDFDCEVLDADEPTVIAKSLQDFEAMKEVFGKASAKR